MIRPPLYDRKASINLFQQKKAHHLMREGHFG